MDTRSLPTIIQGGMGVGVSGWCLARAASKAGALGVVAGTAMDELLARRLQLGDPGGHMRRALDAFPLPAIAQGIRARYFIRGGKDVDVPFLRLPKLDVETAQTREDLTMVGCFAEVYLAKEGHPGMVGINLLEKIQVPTLPSLFGAMLAGVNVVLMGAGIPRAIPGILDQLSAAKPVQLSIDVAGASAGEPTYTQLDPATFFPHGAPLLKRPNFLPIVSSATVASVMVRKAQGRVDGIIVEGSVAGGHNAPPRGRLKLDAGGEPVFGERDVANLEAIGRLGLPFWIAGGSASPEGLAAARQDGAAGIQVGTAFAFCAESGIEPGLKERTLSMIADSSAVVRTDARASPTGFPFKVLQVDGSMSDEAVIAERERVCDLGYLRQAYARSNGRVGWRCSGEPEEVYVAKGGDIAETEGRKCVCNGLLANVGLAQRRSGGGEEAPLVTAGKDLTIVRRMLADHGKDYRAADVVAHLLSGEVRPT